MLKFLRNKLTLIAIFILCMIIITLTSCTSTTNNQSKTKIIEASVIEIEKYGHAVLDMTTAEFISEGYEFGDVLNVTFNSFQYSMPFFDGYYTIPGSWMIRGLSLEEEIALCINYGNFAQVSGITVGDTVEITLVQKAGMLALQELCALKYSDNRGDYPDDVTFANFRPVTLGNISEGKLYRTASPINNEHGRAGYANDLIESVNVATIINLADSPEDIEEYIQEDDFESEYYLRLYEEGKVITLDMTANFFLSDFAETLVSGLKFLVQNEPPYCVHCTEGKDRAGFTIMILSSLMGATLQDIIDDYMISFYNYYGIEKNTNPERYQTILDYNLLSMMFHVTSTYSMEELEQVNLELAITNYLINNGMTESEIQILKEKLS